LIQPLTFATCEGEIEITQTCGVAIEPRRRFDEQIESNDALWITHETAMLHWRSPAAMWPCTLMSKYLQQLKDVGHVWNFARQPAECALQWSMHFHFYSSQSGLMRSRSVSMLTRPDLLAADLFIARTRPQWKS
jgi:hypothetical protein